jgi:hypothetical protein
LRISLLRAASFIALALLVGFSNPGRGDSALRSGLFVSWRIELLADGKRSDESFSVTVAEEVEDGLWRLDLERGQAAGHYRILYRDGGEAPAFDRSRIEEMNALVDGQWRPMDPGELSLLDRVREMETSLADAEVLGDTLVSVDGSVPLHCRRLRLMSEGEAIQDGESVRLRTHWKVTGEVWVSPQVPLGTWVRYHEQRETKKYSEFAGQVFEGEMQVTVTEWSLEKIVIPEH